jgi:hypothetical protein
VNEPACDESEEGWQDCKNMMSERERYGNHHRRSRYWQGVRGIKQQIGPNPPSRDRRSRHKSFRACLSSFHLLLSQLPRVSCNISDPTIDPYFGHKAPTGVESNWLPTGEDFFLIFRLFAPQQALFAKTWTLPDAEMVKR